MEEKSGLIIDSEVMQVTESSSSIAMERDAFKLVIQRLLAKDLRIGVIVTDRSPSIKKLMATSFPNIIHQYDIWHVAKSEIVVC